MFLEKSKWEDADKESIKLYNRDEGIVYTKKGKSVPIVEKRERRNV